MIKIIRVSKNFFSPLLYVGDEVKSGYNVHTHVLIVPSEQCVPPTVLSDFFVIVYTGEQSV